MFDFLAAATTQFSDSDMVGVYVWRGLITLITVGGGGGGGLWIVRYLKQIHEELNAARADRQVKVDEMADIKSAAERELQAITAKANEELERQVAAYKRDADDYKNRVDQLTTLVQHLEREVTRLSDEKSKLMQKLDDLAEINEQYAACRQECARYTEKYEQSHERVQRLLSDQANHISAIEALERENKSLVGQLAQATERASNLDARLTKYASAESAIEKAVIKRVEDMH